MTPLMRNQKLKRTLILAVAAAALAANSMAQDAAPAPAKPAAPEKPPQAPPPGAPGGAAQSTPAKPAQTTASAAAGGAAQTTPANPTYKMDPELAKRYGLTPPAATNPSQPGQALQGSAAQTTQPNPVYKMDPELARRYGLTPPSAANPNQPATLPAPLPVGGGGSVTVGIRAQGGAAAPPAAVAGGGATTLDPALAARYGLNIPLPPAPPAGLAAGPEPTTALPPGAPPGNPEAEDWDALLANGIWEEEVNGSLEKAVEAYSKVLGDYDQRRLAAGQAMFRLAEGYRKQGYLEEARVLYGRVMREFADLPELVEPSQGHMRVTPGAMAARRVTRLAPPAKPPQAGGRGFAWVPNHPLTPLPEPAGAPGAEAESASGFGGGMAPAGGGAPSFEWMLGDTRETSEPALPAEVVAKLKEMDKTELRNALSVTHPDPLLRQLIQGQLEAEREFEERATDLGKDHPSQQKTAALIKALNQQIDDRAAAILAGLDLMASARRPESGGAVMAGSAPAQGQGDQRKILARQLDIQKLRLEEVKKRQEVGAASSEHVWEAEMRVLEVEKELARLPKLHDLIGFGGVATTVGVGHASAASAPPTPSEAPSAFPAPTPAAAMPAPSPQAPPLDRLAQLRISSLEETVIANQKALREVETELAQTEELSRLIQTTPPERLPVDLVKDSRFIRLRDAFDAARKAQQAGAEGPDRAAVELAYARAQDQLQFWVANDYKAELEKKVEFLDRRRQTLAARQQDAFKRLEMEAEAAKAQAAQ